MNRGIGDKPLPLLYLHICIDSGFAIMLDALTMRIDAPWVDAVVWVV